MRTPTKNEAASIGSEAVVLVTPADMARVDQAAVDAGVSILDLMRAAGAAVARNVPEGGSIAILAGIGNNGGDAFAAASLLKEAGRGVSVFALGGKDVMCGAARQMADAWGHADTIDSFDPRRFDIVVDGLFGGGLSRALDGPAAATVDRLNEASVFVVAIDLPSGIDGATGAVRGIAVEADRTITFERRKPGHLLLPGRSHCGTVIVEPIGLPPAALATIAPDTFANEPALWQRALLAPAEIHHKYDRGHVAVFSGGASQTGAARLAAMAALRGGAGLVTVLSRSSALMVNAAHLTAIMLKRCNDEVDLATLLEDDRLSTFVLGPGFGVGDEARAFARAILSANRQLVLDADGITAFAYEPDSLFKMARSSAGLLVLTPHPGEFARLFPDLAGSARTDKLSAARAAAERSGAIVLLKGSDTVVAHPNGRASINATGTPALATAGSGDVLAGLIAAQLANGVPAFEAASAAAWIHGQAARRFGVGLIAEDLPALVPHVLFDLWDQKATG